jgi:hypothetical protein
MKRLALALVAALALTGVAGNPLAAAKKKPKPPCDFKLARDKSHHDTVKIKMTCHKKLVTNVRFKLRKKYTITAFDGFPGGFCSVQSARVAGCVFGGQGAPLNKAVSAKVHVLVPVPAKDEHFADVEIFLSGGDPIGEQLGY